MVTGPGWVAVGCWMSFRGRELQNQVSEHSMLKGGQREENRVEGWQGGGEAGGRNEVVRKQIKKKIYKKVVVSLHSLSPKIQAVQASI